MRLSLISSILLPGSNEEFMIKHIFRTTFESKGSSNGGREIVVVLSKLRGAIVEAGVGTSCELQQVASSRGQQVIT